MVESIDLLWLTSTSCPQSVQLWCADSSFKEIDFIGPAITVHPGSVLSINHSTVNGKHAGDVTDENQHPEDAFLRSFIAVYARLCISHTFVHDAFVKITNTNFSGIPAVAGYRGEEENVHVWVDNPSEVALCEVTVRGRLCDDPSLVCAPTSPNSTQDTSGQPEFLERTAAWLQAIFWVCRP